LKNARKTKLGVSLRQFNLRTHLFKYRCSYMIHSVAFSGLPGPLKKRVLLNLRAALDPVKSHPASGHIPVGEKKAIGLILASTLDNYPQ